MNEGAVSKTYHKIKNRLFYVSLFLDFAVLLLFQVSGLSLQLKSFLSSFSSFPLVTNAAYIIVFCVGMFVVHFPLDFFLGFLWEHRFGLSTERFGAWAFDELKKALLTLVLAVVAIEILYLLLARFPQVWWVGAGMFWLFLSLFLARIMPNVLIPLFYKYSAIDDETLKNRLLVLLEKCRVNIKEIFGINFSSKTKKANAFVCGLGKTRRVVLSDTLMANFTIDEIETVVAHELGHYKHRDILKLTVFNTALIFLSLYAMHRSLNFILGYFHLPAIDDIASLPAFFLGMMILGLLTTPALNAFSRKLETEADRFSIRVTGQRDAFISMLGKLGRMNLAEWDPGWFNEFMFYDHPPLAKRIQMAKKFNVSDA